MDKEIAVYDNTVTARTYLSYIAEQAGGFASIGRDGKLYIKAIGEDNAEVDIKKLKEYSWGEEFIVSRVSYEDGIQDFKFGDETNNTIYINSDNMYIVDSGQVENIYNKLYSFKANSFSGTTIIDPAIDIGDIITIDNKPVIYQGQIDYAGKFIGNIKSTIQAKTKEETTVTKISEKTRIRRIQSSIDQIDGKIEQLVQETGDYEDKLTQVTQDVDSIRQEVSNSVNCIREVNGVTKVTLENCIEGYLLGFTVYGNNSVFYHLYPDDELYPDDDLYPEGDSTIVVTDKDGNSIQYSLGVLDVLRQNEETYDQLDFEKGKITVTRRIDEDGNTLEEEQIEELKSFDIIIPEGDVTIEILSYNAKIHARYAIKTDYSDIFATQIDLSSSISQTAQEIDLNVNKKLEGYSTTTEMQSAIELKADSIISSVDEKLTEYDTSTEVSSKIEQKANSITSTVATTYATKNELSTAKSEIKQTTDSISSTVSKKVGENEIISKINQSAEAVSIQANKISLSGKTLNLADNMAIVSNNFNVDKYGNMTCTNANITGGNIELSGDDGSTVSVYSNNNGRSRVTVYADSTGGGISVGGSSTNDIVIRGGSDRHITCYGYMEATAYNYTSDARLKENINKYEESAIDIVKKGKIYKYNFIQNPKSEELGLVIGEGYECPQELIDIHEDIYSINAYRMASILWKAVQEQQETIETLQKQINELKGE